MQIVRIVFILFNLFFFAASVSWAQSSIELVRGLNFGQVLGKSSLMKIRLDATSDGLPICVPTEDCDIDGGWTGVLKFYDFGPTTIQLNYPNEISLYDQDTNEWAAKVSRMSLLSEAQAHTQNNYQIANVGGELLASSQCRGKDLYGTITISIITF